MHNFQKSTKCQICARGCVIPEGGSGQCGKYTRKDGLLMETAPDRYLVVTPISIETMPLLHYYPQGKFLQITTTGCNFSCPGCVSTMLVRHISLKSSALQHKSPQQIVDEARRQDCLGVTFVMNDPLASFFSFMAVAKEAKAAGLLVGCSSNGYFTKASAELLLPYLDFINIGIKGFTDADYQNCGAATIEPVLETLDILYKASVHVEVSVTYRKGDDGVVIDFVDYLKEKNYDIPIQVMRYLPLEGASLSLEPSIKDAEALCRLLQRGYDSVYLFNTPGTDLLESFCPECGEILISRQFFGPMGAKVKQVRMQRDKPLCPNCGRQVPFRGVAERPAFTEESFNGGYPFTRALEMVQAMLYASGVTDNGELVQVWEKVLAEKHLDSLHEDIQCLDSYIDTIGKYSGFVSRADGAAELQRFMRGQIRSISERLKGTQKRPRVYYSMGKPLFALKGGRFENQLVTAAGGISINKQLQGKGRPGSMLDVDELNEMDPDVMVISSFLSNSTDDYLRECMALGIDVKAVRSRRIYSFPYPNWDFGSPRWILGLMFLANVLHPELFDFHLFDEAEEFYHRFYHTSFKPDHINLSFARPALDWPENVVVGDEVGIYSTLLSYPEDDDVGMS